MHGFFSTILKLAIVHRALDDVLNQTSSYAFGLRVGRPVSLGHVNVPIQDCVRVQVDIGRQMFNTKATIGPLFDVTGSRMKTG